MSTAPLPDLDALRALCEAAASPGPFSRDDARTLGAAAKLLVQRLERQRRGSSPNASTTADGKLLAAACEALGAARGRPLTRGELADKLGIGRASQTMLSPAKLAKYPLSDEHRAKIQAWINGSP